MASTAYHYVSVGGNDEQVPYNLKLEERPQRSFMDRAALGRFPEQGPAQVETEEGPDSTIGIH